MSRDEACCSSSSSLRPSRLMHAPPYDIGYPSPQNEYTTYNTSAAAASTSASSIYDFGYPRPQDECASPVAYNMVSKRSSFSYSRFGNADSAQEIGWDRGDFENQDTRPYMIRWKSGKNVDQRLLVLLESFFQEIYVKREDFFKKIFPGMHEQFGDIFNKIGAMLWKNNHETKYRTLQRSLSVGSPRRLERFKVRTPNVIVRDSTDKTGCSGK